MLIRKERSEAYKKYNYVRLKLRTRTPTNLGKQNIKSARTNRKVKWQLFAVRPRATVI